MLRHKGWSEATDLTTVNLRSSKRDLLRSISTMDNVKKEVTFNIIIDAEIVGGHGRVEEQEQGRSFKVHPTVW